MARLFINPVTTRLPVEVAAAATAARSRIPVVETGLQEVHGQFMTGLSLRGFRLFDPARPKVSRAGNDIFSAVQRIICLLSATRWDRPVVSCRKPAIHVKNLSGHPG